MLRYAINYLKIVNHKGWVRAPVCLHSTDTKRDFSVGAQGNQKETTKPGKLSDQSLSKPLTDPAKLWTKGILDGAILAEKDFGRQNGQGRLMMKTSLDGYQQNRFSPFSNSTLTTQRFINSILSGPSTTLSKLLIDPYEAFSRDVSNKYECIAEPKTIEPTMQPMCPPYTPPPALPCPKPCVPPQFPMQPKCPPKVKKAIDCPKYPYPLAPCPRPKIPSPPPPCDCKEQSSHLNKLPSSEIDNVIDFNEPMNSKVHIMTYTLSNSTCENSPSVSNDPCESEIYSHDGRTSKPVGSPRLCESASLNKSAWGDAQFKFSSANTARRSEFSEPTRKYQDPTQKPQNRDEIDMFDIHEHMHEAQYIETENDINNVSKNKQPADDRNQFTAYRNYRFQSFITNIGISTSAVTTLVSESKKPPLCPPPCHGPQAPIFCDGRKKKKCNGGRQGNCKPSPGKSPCCTPPVCTPPCPPPCSPCPIPPPPCLPTGPRIKYKPPPPQVPCSPCPVRCPPCPRPPPPMCPPICPPPCRPRSPIYGPNPPTPDCPGPLFVPSCPCPNPCPPPCEENTEPPCCPQCPLPCPPKCPSPCPPTCPTKYPPQPKGPCDPHNLLTKGMILTGESDKSATPDRPSEELLPQSLSETESSPFQPKKVYKTSACSCAARSQPLVAIPAQTTTYNYPILPKKKICADTCPEFCYDSKGKPKMCPAPRPDTEYCRKLEGGETEYFDKKRYALRC